MVFKTTVIRIIVISSMLWFTACGTTSRTNADLVKISYLNKLVTEGNFEINSYRAFPLITQGLLSVANAGLLMPGSTASSIDLIGNSNYLRVIGDSVSISLPYFGERQMGGGYGNNDNGIVFNGIPELYEVKWDDKKQRYQIEMQVRQRTETFQFYITLFPSLMSDINVNSTHRFSIRYSGQSKPFSEE